MKKGFTTLAMVATCALAGCAGNIRLLEDGKVHNGTYDQMSKAVKVVIDGVPYTGSYVQGVSTGFATGFSGGRTTTGFMTMSDSSGQALLTSPDGKVLRCIFGPVVAFRGQGQCQNNQGKIYDMLIGG